MQTILNSLHTSLHSLHGKSDSHERRFDAIDAKLDQILEAQLHFYHYVKGEFARMSKTQADVQAALDDLNATTSTALGDIAAGAGRRASGPGFTRSVAAADHDRIDQGEDRRGRPGRAERTAGLEQRLGLTRGGVSGSLPL